MKKSLLAVAAIGAFASAAQAQSSVTVYGILDVGFSGATTRASQTKSNTTALASSSETSSRLGFKGTEDLGGGMNAFFTAEFQLYPTDASLSGDTNNGLFNRQSFVGLSKKGIGQAAIGTQYTPVHTAVSRTDAGQQNNIHGDVIYSVSSGTGATQTTTAYTTRFNNALTLQTDRFAGFQVNGIYSNKNSNQNNPATTQTVSNNTALGLGINYVWQKLNVDLAMTSSKQESITGTTNTAAALPAAAAAATSVNVLGTSIGILTNYAGASYDFGILKAYAQYINTKYTSNLDSNSYMTRSAQQLGVRSFVTPKVEAWASIGNGSFTAGSTALPATSGSRATQDFTGYQLGSNYWLSKRTNLYAIFGSQQVSSSSVAASEGASSYGVGMRHTF
ncbi:porin [Polynucleobacter sp. AP-Jannik-300A-C4]|uniref:porin n=1 Tax=Polynucleobacter sp. AP-Jannik-300A-C4 TaxID=2576928 RepID=UPI001BFD7348|nr:porin [Polynucleobacter sp. AP-Jannik-300A-C4]QWE22762.1 porin [Polynucleobacter sp. AP-Jannik-300A-C4]